MSEKEWKNDPTNYNKMSQPHKSGEADDNLKNFFSAIEKARQEFKIADVAVVIKDTIENEKGEIQLTPAFGGKNKN